MKRKILPLWLLCLVFFSSLSIFGQKKDNPEIPKDTTKNKPQPNVLPTPTANNQSFPFLNVIPPSPQAASLGRYGEIPVSLSTGTASFDVPIYEISAGSLKVPVKLSYHSAGVKANDIASPVGTGWSLLAGGAITRTVRGGLWDECDKGILNQVIPEPSDAANFYCFLGNLNTNTDYVDGMPDDFFYNFNGFSGKFIYNTRNTSNQNVSHIPVTYPYTKMKIDWVNQQYFNITDIDGTIYNFEALEQTVLTQSTTARNNPCGTTYTSAWYLSKIISANRIDTVRFNYSTPVGIQASPIWSTTLTKNVNSFGAKDFSYSYAFQRTDISSIVLNSIDYKNGQVAFTYANDRQDLGDADNSRLTTITIYKKGISGSLSEVKHFSLGHSYFDCEDGRSQVDQPLLNITGHSGSFLLKRLRLDNVTEKASNNTPLPPYSFTYYEPHSLPIYASLAQDFWGYSNGASANLNLLIWNTDLSQSAEPSALYGADCKPNFEYAISGSLKQITYPTGGFSKFLYEPNTAQLPGGGVTKGGGFRIKKIIHNNNLGDTTRTVYNYVSSYLTNILYDSTFYNNVFSFTTQVNAEDNVGGANWCVIHSNTVYPEKISGSLGSDATFVANEIVEEYQTDSLDNRLGKKRYTYSVDVDQVFVDFPNEKVSTTWKRGLLLNEKTYSILPSTSEVVIQEKQTTYTELFQPYKSRGYFVRLSFDNDYNTGFCQTIGNKYCSKYSEHNQYVYAEKNEQSSVLLPTKVKTYNYDQNGINPVIDSVLYEYNTSHLQLTKTITNNSNGKTYENINKYPNDFIGTAVCDTMVNRHILSPIIETDFKENTVSLKKTRTNYKLWYPSTYFGLVKGFIAPFSVETQDNGGAWDIEIVMGETLSSPTQNGYDLRARPILYTDRSKLTTQLEWWENTGRKDLLKKKIAYGLTTEYDYEPTIGIRKIIAPNGLKSTFFYDIFGRLALTQDHEDKILNRYEYYYGTPNKVVTKTYTGGTTGIITSVFYNPGYMTTHAYFDRLGRPIQTVGEAFSPQTKDIVLATQNYDAYGRLDSLLTIYPTENDNGAYISNGLNLAQNFYKDLAPFSKTIYERSPFSRPLSQFGLGNVWHSNDKKIQTFDETAGNDIRYYTVGGADSIKLSGTYAINSLYKKRVIDEQGNTVIEITDKKGQLIQRQQQNGSDWLTTYYIYDGLGRTLAILQPNAFALNASIPKSSSNWTNGVFFYKYDTRDRVIESHVPNSGFDYKVYDTADRLVLNQDAHQRTLNTWSFTKYDGLGREILSGELTNANSRSTIQSQFDSHSTLSETFDSSKPGELYYSNNSFPFGVDSSKAMEVNYYDGYDTWRISGYEASLIYYNDTKGLLTGTLKRYTENRKWLPEVYYHDTKNRVIETVKLNIHGDGERPKTYYRFLGGVSSNEHIYSFSYKGAASIYTSSDYLYDHVERKIRHGFFISGFSKNLQTYIQYDYNEIGQLATKKFQPGNQYEIATNGQEYINRPPALDQPYAQDIASKAIIITDTFVADANDSNTGTYIAEIDTTTTNGLIDALQTVNYEYGIRGQLNCINCRNKLVHPNPKENDLFSMKLGFEDDNRYYDGNISYQTWRTPIVAKNQQYKHYYDGASRLIKSAYVGGVSGSNYSIDTIRYDRNGNIQQLKRNTIDNLSYEYSGNQLLSVSDAGTTVGFNDGNTSGNDYEYWNNGSLKKDKNKGIDSIIYNSYLNKVSRVKFTNGTWVNFYYDAIGTLLKRKLSNGETWVYRDGLIVKNDTTYYFNHDEGRVYYHATTQKWLSEFEYRDHLGNLRVSFRDSLANPVSGVYKPPVLVQIDDRDPTGLSLSGLNYTGVNKNNFGFLNRETYAETGWINLNNRFYMPELMRFGQIDPITDEQENYSPYQYGWNNPVLRSDPNGDCPNCITGAIGAGIGALVGGGIELGRQLWNDGKVTSWKAVGGSTLQGAITGGAAGFTGGASLVGTAAVAGTANVVGGTANRMIQGKETTAKDVVIDATVGAGLGAAGKVVGNLVKGTTDKLSNSAKGKLGEKITEMKYAAKGYKSNGKAVVRTGGTTPTGKVQRALYDHSMENRVTGRTLTVESKFNSSTLTPNQVAAQSRITTPGGLIIDRTTSEGLGNTAKAVTTGTGAGIDAQRNRN